MIETVRLDLRPASLAHFEALVRSEDELGELLGANVEPGWLGFDVPREAIAAGGATLAGHAENAGWSTYWFIARADRRLVGLGGYKGAPANGSVEIGYALAPAYRGRGLASEAACVLVDRAFSLAPISRVVAHTLAETTPSTRLLDRLGFTHVATVHDPDDGEVWQWEVTVGEWVEARATDGGRHA